MIKAIYGRNVPEAYTEALWAMQICGVEEDSRNGIVRTVPYPVMLEIDRPWERVLFHPTRDANPFFHVMEFIWHMAGSNDAEWIAQFNKRMLDYADDEILRGAYGWRWANPASQIQDTISLLQTTPETRQAVITMWDPVHDGHRALTSDRPCNTHIYFRRVKGKLTMTVCNRSNDLIWGMLGVNAVVFTMLHELIAHAVGMPQGVYRVFTNNLHVYKDLPRYDEIMNDKNRIHDPYSYDDVRPQPLLVGNETWEDFRADCVQLVAYGLDFDPPNTWWMEQVGIPMHEAYLDKESRSMHISAIEASDWCRVCQEWNTRRV